MGNCQAIDNATLILRHPNGSIDKMYNPVTASDIMKMHPGHYVALLLTTTTTTTTTLRHHKSTTNHGGPVRITRIKLLKATDTLLIGHVYRLLTIQEVMKGLWAKQCAKKNQLQLENLDSSAEKKLTIKETAELEEAIKKYEPENTNQEMHERLRSRIDLTGNSNGTKSRNWHPSLQSISEATGN